jgi:predicted HTH transcriptional regulator
VHNDWNLGWPTVEFFSDRVTITSTGGLVEGLSQEDFFNGRSMLRNRELMRIFRDVELVEGLGSGMRRILEVYDRSVFEITPSFVIVTFSYEPDFERSSVIRSVVNERSLERNLSEVMSEAEIIKTKPIMDYIEMYGSITPQEAREILGKSSATARRYLSLLRGREILEDKGNTNAVSYTLKPTPYMPDFERSNVIRSAVNERSYERSLSEVLSEAEMLKTMPIIEHIKKHGSITPGEACGATGKSPATTRRYLHLLCERGVLESKGNTSSIVYIMK